MIDTKGVFEDSSHLRLDKPVAVIGNRPVRVLLLFEDGPDEPVQFPDFRSAIGSYQRDFPGSPVRSSSDWLKDLREGE